VPRKMVCYMLAVEPGSRISCLPENPFLPQHRKNLSRIR
jgi:hypothetical protein